MGSICSNVTLEAHGNLGSLVTSHRSRQFHQFLSHIDASNTKFSITIPCAWSLRNSGLFPFRRQLLNAAPSAGRRVSTTTTSATAARAMVLTFQQRSAGYWSHACPLLLPEQSMRNPVQAEWTHSGHFASIARAKAKSMHEALLGCYRGQARTKP